MMIYDLNIEYKLKTKKIDIIWWLEQIDIDLVQKYYNFKKFHNLDEFITDDNIMIHPISESLDCVDFNIIEKYIRRIKLDILDGKD